MRALLDTNVLISYLLRPLPDRYPTIAIDAALGGAYTILLPEELIAELSDKIETKRYLTNRISRAESRVLIAALSSVGEPLPTITESFPAIGRDRRDDWVLAYAVVYHADFIVTGDDDLLSLGSLAHVAIVTPAEFAARLAAQADT